MLFLISVLLYAATGCGVKNTDVQKKPASGSLAPALFSVSRQISVRVCGPGRGEGKWELQGLCVRTAGKTRRLQCSSSCPPDPSGCWELCRQAQPCQTLMLGWPCLAPAPPGCLWGSCSLPGFAHPCGSRGGSGEGCGFVIWFLWKGSRNALRPGLGGKLCPHNTQRNFPK